MLEVVKSTLLIISALLPIVNPLSSTPIFLLLTRDYDSSTRMKLAWKIAFNSSSSSSFRSWLARTSCRSSTFRFRSSKLEEGWS